MIMFIGSIWAMLSFPPNEAITAGDYGWLIVRGITLAWSIIMSLGVYSRWVNYHLAIKELYQLITNEKRDVPNYAAYPFNLLSWLSWWIILSQTLVIFYIANYCANGY